MESPCRYYGQCTGCQWQHVAYPAQLTIKQEKVRDALRRVGGLQDVNVLPTLPSPLQFGYRNHARFTVGKAGDLGFVNRETRRFLRIDDCMLMHDGINQILSRLQDRCAETTQLAVRAGRDTGDFLVQPTLKTSEIDVPTGQKHYRESVSGHEFRVASPSFFQVNVDQASQLIETVREALALGGEEVILDAYTGVGTFAVLLAPHAKKIYAIEESSAAVADARENAAGIPNVEFLLGKTEDVLAELPERPDVVILDPPRAGCQASARGTVDGTAPGPGCLCFLRPGNPGQGLENSVRRQLYPGQCPAPGHVSPDPARGVCRPAAKPTADSPDSPADTGIVLAPPAGTADGTGHSLRGNSFQRSRGADWRANPPRKWSAACPGTRRWWLPPSRGTAS